MCVLLISGSALEQLLDPEYLIEKARAGFVDYAKGLVVNPQRTVIVKGENWWGVMPCLSPYGFVLKAVGVIPSNSSRGLATTQASVLVTDPETGALVAVMNGTVFTAIRTAIVSSVFMSLFPRPKRLFVFGAGLEAKYHCYVFSRLFPDFSVNCSSRSERTRKAFMDWCLGRGIPLDPGLTAAQADTLVLATSSQEPVLQEISTQNRVVVSIGAHTRSAREVGDRVLACVDRIVMDTEEGCTSESGDVVHALSSGIVDRSKLISLSDLVSGVRLETQKVLYKSVGAAFQDAYVASGFVELARSRGAGVNFDMD